MKGLLKTPVRCALSLPWLKVLRTSSSFVSPTIAPFFKLEDLKTTKNKTKTWKVAKLKMRNLGRRAEVATWPTDYRKDELLARGSIDKRVSWTRVRGILRWDAACSGQEARASESLSGASEGGGLHLPEERWGRS